MSSKRERERWARNERVRRRVLELDRGRPAAELLAETIAVSASAMKLRAAARHRSRYEGIRIRYCSRDHLIAMKRAAGRPRDLLDLDELGAESA